MWSSKADQRLGIEEKDDEEKEETETKSLSDYSSRKRAHANTTLVRRIITSIKVMFQGI